MTDDDKKRLQSLLDEHAAQLGEHFESVRIFATAGSDDGQSNTVAFDTGTGNFYAQLGQVVEWLAIQDQYQRNWADRKDGEKEL